MDITYTEPLVTLPLKEYNELKTFKEEIEKGKVFVNQTITTFSSFHHKVDTSIILLDNKDIFIERNIKLHKEEIEEINIRHIKEVENLNQEIENLRNQNLSLLAKKTKKNKFIFF